MNDAILVGVDTGIVNVVGISREDSTRGFVYSSKRWRHETAQTNRNMHSKKMLKREKRRNPTFKQGHDEVDNTSFKTINEAKLKRAIITKRNSYTVLNNFYGCKTFTYMRWRNYTGTQKTLPKVLRMVVTNEKDVIVVGDASFNGNMKGHAPGLATKFVNYLTKNIDQSRIVYQDEFRTSKLDSDHHKLVIHPSKKIYTRRSEGAQFVQQNNGISQISLSKSEFGGSGFSRTWNRDINAARNIRQNYRALYENGHLPDIFTRGKVEQVPENRASSYKYVVVQGNIVRRTQKKFKNNQLVALMICTCSSSSWHSNDYTF
jgi:hypothetical protein